MDIILHRDTVQYAERVRAAKGPSATECPFALEVKLLVHSLSNRYIAITHNQIIMGEEGARGIKDSERLDIYDLDENAIKWIARFEEKDTDWEPIDNGHIFKTTNRKHISKAEWDIKMKEYNAIMNVPSKTKEDQAIRDSNIRAFKI